jgi:hypothetical protein
MRTFGALALCVCVAVPLIAGGRPEHRPGVRDQSDREVDPLGPGPDVRVFVFVRRDCPVANRYAPELERLRQQFNAVGLPPVVFFLVYVDPADTASLVEAHRREYHMTLPWLLDPSHELARRAGATITPEAAVYGPWTDGRRARLYVGRIDDRFLDVGRTRPAATRHDLADALDAAVAGRQPAPAGGPAVGCFIEDAR